MGRKCFKCGHERLPSDIAPDYECPNCGAVYAKVEAARNGKFETPKSAEGVVKRPEIDHVASFRKKHLKGSESILAWSAGYIGEMMGEGEKRQHNGVLIVTGERVVFHRNGFFGEIVETIPLANITSIERRSMMGHRTIRIHTSHDQLEFKTFADKVEEQGLVAAIEAGRENRKLGNDRPPSRVAEPMELLEQLAKLKELGVITEAEFRDKKAELLAKL